MIDDFTHGAAVGIEAANLHLHTRRMIDPAFDGHFQSGRRIEFVGQQMFLITAPIFQHNNTRGGLVCFTVTIAVGCAVPQGFKRRLQVVYCR